MQTRDSGLVVVAAWAAFEGNDYVRFAITADGTEWRKWSESDEWKQTGPPLPLTRKGTEPHITG